MSNSVTKEQQVNWTMEMLVQGYSRREIVEKASEMWGFSHRTGDDLIARARQQFVDNVASIDRKQIVAEAIERYDYLYRKGVDQRQLAVSIAAQQAKMKMIGCESPKD